MCVIGVMMIGLFIKLKFYTPDYQEEIRRKIVMSIEQKDFKRTDSKPFTNTHSLS